MSHKPQLSIFIRWLIVAPLISLLITRILQYLGDQTNNRALFMLIVVVGTLLPFAVLAYGVRRFFNLYSTLGTVIAALTSSLIWWTIAASVNYQEIFGDRITNGAATLLTVVLGYTIVVSVILWSLDALRGSKRKRVES